MKQRCFPAEWMARKRAVLVYIQVEDRNGTSTTGIISPEGTFYRRAISILTWAGDSALAEKCFLRDKQLSISYIVSLFSSPLLYIRGYPKKNP